MAWITIPGTNIDAPVQQYGDNDYYLRRDEKGVKDYHGCIYADYACRMDSGIKVSRNLIFYGHTFTDEDYVGGFEDLHKYRVFEFGQENPYIYVSLADEKLTYQIFSVWVCDVSTSINQLGNDQQAAVRVCRTGGERQNMVIRCHVHTIIERTAGNSITQNLLEGRIVRVGLNAVSVGGNITDPHTENLVSQFFICQRNINVRVLLPKLEHTIFV